MFWTKIMILKNQWHNTRKEIRTDKCFQKIRQGLLNQRNQGWWSKEIIPIRISHKSLESWKEPDRTLASQGNRKASSLLLILRLRIWSQLIGMFAVPFAWLSSRILKWFMSSPQIIWSRFTQSSRMIISIPISSKGRFNQPRMSSWEKFHSPYREFTHTSTVTKSSSLRWAILPFSTSQSRSATLVTETWKRMIFTITKIRPQT